MSATFSSCQEQQPLSPPTVKEALDLFEQNPEDCFVTEQLAGAYQAENDVASALKYYEIAIANCSENILDYFQLGVCYFLSGERENGEKYMDKAISLANQTDDIKLQEMLVREKKSWLTHKKEKEGAE